MWDVRAGSVVVPTYPLRERLMRAINRRAVPPAYAVHLAALAAGVAGVFVAATVLAPVLGLGTLVLAILGVGALLPVAWGAADAPDAPRVRSRADGACGGRAVRLGLRRRPKAAAPGWRPSAWDPRGVVPWSPGADHEA